jgi:hypothetical protein
LIDSFGGALETHLGDEIDTLSPENMKKIFNSVDEAKEITEGMVKHGIQNSSPWITIPFVCTRFAKEELMIGYDDT